jgi:hypothetical protein
LLATKTIRFISIKEIPAGIKPTYRQRFPAQKRRPLPHPLDHWRRPSHLYRRSQHQGCRHHHRQDAFQQRIVYAQRKTLLL